jgi:hypothetical protein
MQKTIKLLLILIIVCVPFFLVTDVSAETEETQTSAQELGVSNPTLLPNNPFYFLKEWGRGIQSFFTFGSLKKAELQQKFSNERLVELEKLVENGTIKSEILERAAEKYGVTMDKIKDLIDKVEDTTDSSDNVNKFLEKFTDQQMLHERILLKLQTHVSDGALEKIEQARERHMEKFGEVMQKLEANQERLQERIQNASKNQVGGDDSSDLNEDENSDKDYGPNNSNGNKAGQNK